MQPRRKAQRPRLRYTKPKKAEPDPFERRGHYRNPLGVAKSLGRQLQHYLMQELN